VQSSLDLVPSWRRHGDRTGNAGQCGADLLLQLVIVCSQVAAVAAFLQVGRLPLVNGSTPFNGQFDFQGMVFFHTHFTAETAVLRALRCNNCSSCPASKCRSWTLPWATRARAAAAEQSSIRAISA